MILHRMLHKFTACWHEDAYEHEPTGVLSKIWCIRKKDNPKGSWHRYDIRICCRCGKRMEVYSRPFDPVTVDSRSMTPAQLMALGYKIHGTYKGEGG